MKVLITGGAGFIGSHLAERHLSMGDDVEIIDNLSTSDITNVQHLESHAKCNCVIDDILNVEVMRSLVADAELIYHLAAAVGVQYILDNPLSSIVTNVQGTEVVLELCNKFRKKVLIASTSPHVDPIS